MPNSIIRKTIGSRIRNRRKEMKLSLQNVADKLGISVSTVHRYENGTIDNTKKLVLESIARVLHVTPEWLKGETDDILLEPGNPSLNGITDVFNEIIAEYPLEADEQANEFSRNLLQLLLIEVRYFNKCFTNAVSMYTIDNQKYALLMEMEPDEYNSVMFRREIKQTINDFDRIVTILHNYSQNPVLASKQLKKMLTDFDLLFDRKYS